MASMTDPAPLTDLAPLKIDDFSTHLNTIFNIQTKDGTIALKLAKADWAGHSKRAGGAFSLSFIAPGGPLLPQAIYPVTHPALGTMEIFLVPAGSLPGGHGYHAVFT